MLAARMTRVREPSVEEFSYAAPDDPRLKRLVIRAVERMTGQPHLKRLYNENRTSPRDGETFWDAAVRLLKLHVRYDAEALAAVPREGPLVVVANHPYGVLDGIVMCWLMAKVRREFKVLTNSLLYRADEIRPWLLPIDFAETKEALETNLRTRALAKDFLTAGGALVIFPGGTVSTTPRPFARHAFDPEWKTFAARMIVQAKAPVLPIFFSGQNSRLFQLASHVSMTLRLSLLFKEVHARIGTDFDVKIGAPIPHARVTAIADRQAMMQWLRDQTYALGGLTPETMRLRIWKDADG